MTHGKPGEPNCATVLSEVYLLLDRECTEEHAAQLRMHLDDCPPCLEEYGIDQQLKQLLARKCGGDHAPEQLKARLQASIRQAVDDHVNDGGEQKVQPGPNSIN